MIDTKEQYEERLEMWREVYPSFVDLPETIEALREVARASKAVRDESSAATWLNIALDALPDWLTE